MEAINRIKVKKIKKWEKKVNIYIYIYIRYENNWNINAFYITYTHIWNLQSSKERKKVIRIYLLFERRKREAVKKRCKLIKNIKQKPRSLSGYFSKTRIL